MRVFLTGATGFLGNNLLRMLLADGHEVIANYRQSSLPESLAELDFHALQGGLNSSAIAAQIADGVDAIVHCAAQIQIGKTRLDECRKVNVEGTRSLAAMARERSIRFVHVSTVDTLAHAVDGKPVVEGQTRPAKPAATYVVTKREAEEVVSEKISNGLDAVIVHPGFMLGRWDWRPSSAEMMISVAKYRPPFAPGGGASVADVRDVSAGIIQAISRGKTGEHYILGGENLSYLNLWQRMAQVIGCRSPRFPLPNWVAGLSGMFGDLKTRFAGVEGTVNSMATRLGQLNHFYSSEKAINELAYSIRPVDEAIESCWAWIQERGWGK
ncbi:MAG: SDR family oxidoreductase [Pirellulaceae bacterium]